MIGAAEQEALLGSEPDAEALFPAPPSNQIPKDSYRVAYTTYFVLGVGFLLPWNTFTAGIDYFTYLYPGPNVNRIFAIATMLCVLRWSQKSTSLFRTNFGLAILIFSLSTIPIIDIAYTRGRVELFHGFYFTVAAVGLCGIAKPLVESEVVGAAGELPAQYMQATGSGQAASGVIVSILRITTKTIYPHDPPGLRCSANLYFAVSIFIILICIICCNISEKLPVVQFYKHLKIKAKEAEEEQVQLQQTKSPWRSNIGKVASTVKLLAFVRFLTCAVTSSIFPGHLTEDVHSPIFEDWYAIFLISCYHVSNLVGTSLPAVYLTENERFIFIAAVSRLVLYPLFLGCKHGPGLFRTELPIATLTCLLGLSHGYVAAVPLILAPKKVPKQLAEEAGISMVFFTDLGLLVGSAASWLWII